MQPRKFEIAPSTETERRAREVQLLLNVVEPDPEYQPFILTDEACLLDAVAADDDTIRARLRAYFRGEFQLDLKEPIWKLVDRIKRLHPDWPDEW
ncbi:MAG: hypothetical protein ACRERC_06775 [Candidatus Binatia bacterium]